MSAKELTRSRTIILCGPPLSSLGGGPTHIKNMLASPLKQHYRLMHFETGSRGTESPAKDERFLSKLWRLVSSPIILGCQIVRSRADIVHINSAICHKALWRDLVYTLICKGLGRRVVLQLHGGVVPFVTFCRGRLMRWVVRTAFAIPDVLVLLASSEKREFANLGISHRAIVIQNGIDVSQYQGGGRAHSGQIKRLVYLGRLFRPKGIFEVMEAVRLLRHESGFEDIDFRIAGSGPDEKAIRDFIDTNQLADNVNLVGPVHNTAKVRFLLDADVFVFPTYHQEGLPYAILESLAAGTPVVASRVAGIPDVVLDKVHGLLVDARDPRQIASAIRELAKSETALRAMSVNCMKWAREKLSLERLAEQFRAVYDALLDNGDVPGQRSNVSFSPHKAQRASRR